MNQPPTLRSVLRANAVFATTTGLIALVTTGPAARLLGIGEHHLVSATGAGLLLFAAVLVVASVVVVGLAGLPAMGNLVISVIAAIVGLFATVQLRAIARVEDDGSNQTVEGTKVLDRSVDQVWPVVVDHEAYAAWPRTCPGSCRPVRFELRPKPGPTGAAFAAAMTTGATSILRRVLAGWQNAVDTSLSPRPTGR